MVAIHPQYIVDSNGKRTSVVISIQEFKSILEQLEDVEDVRLYDEAKKEDNGDRILFSDYLKNRKNG